MRLRIAALAFLLFRLSLSAAQTPAAETPIPPSPTQWVTDTANFMSPAAAQSLNSQLSAYSQQTGHQLIVYIGQTTGGDPIDDWAVRAFEKWKVGRKGIDDGLVLFIMAQDKKLRFEVGYGLEGDVPDAIASRIINEVIVPRIQAGDHDGAVTAGMAAVVRVISGQGLPTEHNERNARQPQPVTLGQIILFGIIGVIVLIVFATNPSLAIYLIASLLSGGDRSDRGGGFGGGFGGFGGGGGRSGGGGASGSW